jgi:hypothetical protein
MFSGMLEPEVDMCFRWKRWIDKNCMVQFFLKININQQLAAP